MSAQVIRGSKQEIAECVARMPGEIREVIVFVEEPPSVAEDFPRELFASMEPFAVRVGGADYSRDALYGRMEGE